MYKFNVDNECNNKIIIDKYKYESKEILLSNSNINNETNINNIYLKKLKKIIKSVELINMIHYKDDMTCKHMEINDYNALICKTMLDNVIKRTEISSDDTLQNSLMTQILVENNHSSDSEYKIDEQKILYDVNINKINKYKDNMSIHIDLFTQIINDYNSSFNLNMVILPDFDSFNFAKISQLEHLQEIHRKKMSGGNLTLDDVNLIYYFLSDIKFNCYFYDNSNQHNKNIFLYNVDDKLYFNTIKQHITQFIVNKFFYGNMNYLNYLTIDISIDKNHIPYISFIILNKYEQVLFRPYYNVYNYINFEDFIYNIENDIKNNLFIIKDIPREKLYEFEQSHNNYKKIYSGHKDWKEEPIENIQDTDEYFYLNLFKKNIDNIEIISNYYALNKYQTNCAHSLIVVLHGKKYIMNIMSNTTSEYNRLQRGSNVKNFKDDYNNALLSGQYNEINDIISYGYTKLPAILKIIIYELPIDNKENIEYKILFNESKEDYEIANTYLKNEVVIKMDIVLTLLWYSEYRKIYNIIEPKITGLKSKLFFLEDIDTLKQFIDVPADIERLVLFMNYTQKFLNIPPIAYAMISIIDFNDEFFLLYKMSSIVDIIAYYSEVKPNGNVNRRDLTLKIEKLACRHKSFEKVKKVDNISLTRLLDELFSKPITQKTFLLFIYDYIVLSQSSYIAWHTPSNLQITNMDFLNEYLDKIITVTKETLVNPYDTDMLTSIITKKVHSEKKYSHSRETTRSFCNFYELYESETIIYNIRNATILQLSKIKDLIKRRKMSNSLSFFHYFSNDNYNVLHCHVYDDYFNTPDISGKNIDISYERAILLDKINTNNNPTYKPYLRKNMVVSLKEAVKEKHSIEKFMHQDIIKMLFAVNKFISRNNRFEERFILSGIERFAYNSSKQVAREEKDRRKYLKYKQKYLQLKTFIK